MSKETVFPLYPLVLLNQSEQDLEFISALSLWTVSAERAPLTVNHKQDPESLSAPGSDCLCQAGAFSWSGGSVNPELFMEASWSAIALKNTN